MNKTRVAAGGLVASAALLVSVAMNEGYVGQTYKDVVGVQTIGFGETKNVKANQTTTPVRALIQLEKSMDEHAAGMVACISAPINQGEFDAYLDLTYNIGVGAFCGSSLVKKLNTQDYAGACQEILKWTRAGGVVLPALVIRRQKEYSTCMGQQ